MWFIPICRMAPNKGSAQIRCLALELAANIRHQEPLLPQFSPTSSGDTMAKKNPKVVSFQSPKAEETKQRPARRSEQLGYFSHPRAVLYNKSLTGNDRSVAWFLYDHLEPGTAYATGSYDTIANDLGIAKPTVIRCIHNLFTHRVIKAIEKIENSRGGYFHRYKMEMYGYGKLRDASKIKEFKPKESPAKDHSQQILRKVKAGKLGDPLFDDGNQCPDCKNTKWVRVEGTKSVRPCQTCKGKG